MPYRLIIAITISIVLIGCDKQELVGEVNGKDITKAQFNHYLKFKNIPQQDEKRSKQILQDYMQREAFAQIIENSKKLDVKLIEVELNEFRKQILISRYFEKFLNDKVNDEAIQNFYNTNDAEFQREQIKVAHILIRTHDKMSDTEKQASLTKAQEAYSKVKSGKKFADMAKEYSQDTLSAKKGGELGWINKGAIDPAFSAKVFQLKAGDISEPFKSAFGFHVVKVLEEPKVTKTPFDKVKGNIKYRLRQQAKDAEMKRFLSEAKIKYL